MEAASPVKVEAAASPPVLISFQMEVASLAKSEPIDSPPLAASVAMLSAAEIMELIPSGTSGVAIATVARRADVIRVNFIMD